MKMLKIEMFNNYIVACHLPSGVRTWVEGSQMRGSLTVQWLEPTIALSQVYEILWAHLGYLSNMGMPWEITGKCLL